MKKIMRFFWVFFVTTTSIYSYGGVGFRDLIIGSKQSDALKHCVQVQIESNVHTCYEIDDLTFYLHFRGVDPDYCKNRKDDLTEYLSSQGTDYGFIVDGLRQNEPVEINFDFNFFKYDNEELYEYLSGFWYYKKTYWCPESNISVYPPEGLEQYLKTEWRKKEPGEGKVDKILTTLGIDFGSIYQQNWETLVDNPENPFVKLRSSLDSRYKKDWEFTGRDEGLFNSGQKNHLWISYEQGQIQLLIIRLPDQDIRLRLTYYTISEGLRKSQVRKPKNVKFDNF